MSKILRRIGFVAMVMMFVGACLDEQPPADGDLGDTNQPLMMDMGEVSDECELGDACGDGWEDEGETW